MVRAQGNNIMTKVTNLRLVFLLVLPFMLSACSDTDDVSKAVSSTIEQEQSNSKPVNQEIIQTTSKDVHLQDLIHHVAQAKRHAEMHGFVWSTTNALVDKGYAEADKGNEKIAKSAFQEAKLQFELSMEQAKYAAQHWQLLVPEEY
jgi:hypothetical protein